MELHQDDIDGKVTALLAKSTATEEALQDLKSMLRTYIGKEKDAEDCSPSVSKSALENQAVTHVDLSAAIPGNGDGTSLIVENLDKGPTADNEQVRNHVNCPIDTPEPPADHEGCATAGIAKDKGQSQKETNIDILAPQLPSDHEGCAAVGKAKDKARPQKETNTDAKRISKDHKAKKPQTTKEESCPISLVGQWRACWRRAL
jgi:hypothetical protein